MRRRSRGAKSSSRGIKNQSLRLVVRVASRKRCFDLFPTATVGDLRLPEAQFRRIGVAIKVLLIELIDNASAELAARQEEECNRRSRHACADRRSPAQNFRRRGVAA